MGTPLHMDGSNVWIYVFYQILKVKPVPHVTVLAHRCTYRAVAMVLGMTVPMETSDVFAFTPIPVKSNCAASHVPRSLAHVPASCSCPDSWTWNWKDRSPEADLSSDCDSLEIEPLDGGSPSGLQHRTVVFHPYWSNGTAAVRGTKPLNAFSVHYWEVNNGHVVDVYLVEC